MPELALMLLLFAFPALASGWRSLGVRALVCLAVTLGIFLYVTGGRLSLTVPGGDADIGAGIVLYYAVGTFVSGIAARAVSLGVRQIGHPRPWSLWIEATFFVGVPALLRSA